MGDEANLQRKIVSYAKQQGCLVKRNHAGPGAERGWPDLLIIAPNGTHLWLEVKAPGNKPSPLQEYRISELRKRNTCAVWAADFAGAKRFIDKIVRDRK